MYIHVYNGEQQISEGDGTNPLVIGPLNASDNEVSEPVALTVKTEPGYKTFGVTTIGFAGGTSNKWLICNTINGTYRENELQFPEEITSEGLVFYVKAKATEDEAPANDTSVDITLSTVITVAE